MLRIRVWPFLINPIEHINADEIDHQPNTDPKNKGGTHYARPPQIPSRLMSKKTNVMLRPSASAEKNPKADSNVSVSRMKPWRIDGNARKRGGSGGIPREMEEREKKTKVWYTSY
jgi:hypothetical protein